MADIDETQKQANELKETIGDLVSTMEKMASVGFGQNLIDTFEKSSKSASSLESHLAAIVKSGTDLPKGISTAAELQKAMSSNAKVFENIQTRVLSMQQKKLDEYNAKAVAGASNQLGVMTDMGAKIEFIANLHENLRTIHASSTDSLSSQLSIINEQSEEVGNLSKIWQGIAELIPASLGQFAKDFPKALNEAFNAGSVESSVDAISKPVEELLDSVPYIGGVLKAGFKIIRSAFFATWDYIEERVLPVNRELMKQFGAMTPQIKQLQGGIVGIVNQFEALGKGLGKGAGAALANFAAALKTTNFASTKKDMKGLLDVGIRLSEVVGMSAEESGNLAIAFDRAGMSTKQLKGGLIAASVVASDFGVPINQVQKDMGQFPNILQRFGAANSLEFSKASAMARAYGTTIDNVDKSFGRNMDSFDKTAESAANLNAVFGTNINSLELMMETDPSKRMTMVGKSLVDQGKNWENMSVFQKNVIKDTLDMDDAMGALVFSQKNVGMSSEIMSRKMRSAANEQKKMQEAQEQWDKSIGGLKTQLLNFEDAITKITVALSNAVLQFLGMGSAQTTVIETAGDLKKVLLGISTSINEWVKADGPKKLREDLEGVLDTVKDILTAGGKVAGVVNSFFGDDEDEAQEKRAKEFAEAEAGLHAYVRKRKAAARQKALDQQEGPKATASINDGIITKSGQIIKLNPNDNILATKANITPNTINNMKGMSGRHGNGQQNATIEPKVEILRFEIDGKKIAEAQVRISQS